MLRKMFLAVMAIVFLASLSGCATLGKKKDLELQELRSQVTALEAELQNRDRKVTILTEELGRVIREKQAPSRERAAVDAVSKPTTKQVQLALKNAGYDTGKIDGRMGSKTREAIRSFQRANDLVIDGKVGKKTWEALRGFLDMQAK